ncbi:MAG: GDP-mannose 4,6-dehydratase [Chloroflexi bacterium 13_1_40CM_2_70_6]|nr:MAG: GDP-mannose 4,6-dehydratase [Chloroflexi bacterium 13_1_40CM_2_70_6]OLE76184.1 MAG: GDP-mannose 4,6-dehydratase [Chloroflexi bacterium 13_1_20CM_2_70_9]
MRVLITGITGFAGSHLAEYILAEHPEVAVYGTYRWRSRMENLEQLSARGVLDVIEGRYSAGAGQPDEARKGRVTLLHCELTDAGAVEKLIATLRPDRVFHLAAQSFVQSSFDEPAATMRINVESQLNLLEAIRRHDTTIRVHIAGSSEEYGLVHPDEVPMKETNPLRPLSPYAVSKVAQDKLAYQYFKSYGLHLVTTRGFNHTGPRRGTHFVTSTIARQIALIEAGKHEPVIYHGDLTSKRDWTDVRDMVGAYWLGLERGEAGEVYNVGRGRTWTVGEMLSMLLAHSTVKIRTQEDPARLRPSDVPILWADASKFHKATGWEPQIPFEQTLRDLLDYWRARVATETSLSGVTGRTFNA